MPSLKEIIAAQKAAKEASQSSQSSHRSEEIAEEIIEAPKEPEKEKAKIEADQFNSRDMSDTFSGEAVSIFKDAVKVLHNCFDEPDAVRSATVNILRGLKEHPEFTKILLPEDCQLMVRALRQSYQITVSSKVANKETRKKKAADIDAVADMIGDIGDFS